MRRTIRPGLTLAGMIVAGLAGLAIGAAVPLSGTAGDEAAIGAMVRRYILAHPEIIPEAMERLRITPERAAIESPFPGAWAGDPKGNVTLVIFSDYNCPYCRATAPELDRLLAADPKLKIVWREMPVLGRGATLPRWPRWPPPGRANISLSTVPCSAAAIPTGTASPGRPGWRGSIP